MLGKRIGLTLGVLAAVLCAVPAAAAFPPTGEDRARQKLQRHAHSQAAQARQPSTPVTKNFEVVGHNDLGLSETNGDVWVHADHAYVGTWSDPCNGRGVKIVDVSDPANPQLVGTVAAREGTSAEDMKVISVDTPFFTGDLLGVGIQRCGDDPALDTQEFGLQLWDVTDPSNPVMLGEEFGVGHGSGGVHELDLFQRSDGVYALLAHPFSEWFDPAGHGDFMIVDITNPEAPVMTADWGAGENGFSRGPFWGQGSFGTMYGHSARASADGSKAYVSYWDLGVLTFDIRDVSTPVLLSRTRYKPWEDGDAHSMTPLVAGRRTFIFQNDEDYDPTTPARIRFAGGEGIGVESVGLLDEPGAPPLWLQPGHRIRARVVLAAGQGCTASDYPPDTAGAIAVVRTPIPFFDPPGTVEDPLCLQQEQAAAAEAAGARAVVHDVISANTSPQWLDFGSVEIPVLFTDHQTATGMVAAGRATLRARDPAWGFLRVYDAKTGKQVAKFDRAPNVRTLPAPPGIWSIHNTEILSDRAYSSWYSNGIVALDIEDFVEGEDDDDPRMVGQFVPGDAPSTLPGPSIWGVAISASDGLIFASDEGSGLWIVKPTGRAAPDEKEDDD
jgi:hypothetical protein